ncbi:Nuclease (SNase-like) OB-fold [Penicillium hetheringtonii]|uniref:Nuclease (SNase-like) OB-fold n=1 Tax=Penicillium hetheringtonii TaxID=911720 RepID=A0AAD6GLH6_9EURO|nr:Nuclease (SNase-like) OB-fold [Penicillium hetheringtonii]
MARASQQPTLYFQRRPTECALGLCSPIGNSFEIQAAKYIETYPIKGVADLTTVVSMPKTYEVRFIPRDEDQLRKDLEEIDGERSQ